MGKFRNIKGMSFGLLTVCELAGRDRFQKFTWRCECACGTSTVVSTGHLTTGHTTSCGCQQIKTKHGHAGGRDEAPSPTYASWKSMIARCTLPSGPEWHRYGGRGISVCDRWIGADGFANFLADMGPRPSGKTIDRRDNNNNYEPENCQWSTRREQYATRSTTKLSDDLAREIHGRSEHGESRKSIAARMKISVGTVAGILVGRTWRHIFAEGTA